MGDPVVIRGAKDEILGKGALAVSSLVYAVCSFTFRRPGSEAGKSGYTIKVGDFESIVATLSEIDTDQILLSIRSGVEVEFGEKGRSRLNHHNLACRQ